MYSREIGDQVRTFGVSGKLWHGVLVLFDRQTGTLWTQLDGRAIHGPEQGRHLEHVPSVFTVWGMWREKHPETLVLEKSAEDRERKQSAYAAYFADRDRLYSPHLAEGLDDALAPKDVVFGVRAEGGALVVAERVLERRAVVNARIGDLPVALLRSFLTGEVVAVVRRHSGREVELEPVHGAEPTERVRIRGGGELAVDQLPGLRVDRAYWYAWARTVGGGSATPTLIVE